MASELGKAPPSIVEQIENLLLESLDMIRQAGQQRTLRCTIIISLTLYTKGNSASRLSGQSQIKTYHWNSTSRRCREHTHLFTWPSKPRIRATKLPEERTTRKMIRGGAQYHTISTAPSKPHVRENQLPLEKAPAELRTVVEQYLRVAIQI